MQKLLKLKFSGLLLLAIVFSLSSCLKNNKYAVDFGSYEPSIELPLAAMNVNTVVPVALTTTVPAVEWRVVVNVASMDKPDNPVTATLALDVDYLNQFNTENDAAAKAAQQEYLEEDTAHTVDDDDYPADYEYYQLLPDSLYTIDTWDLTVPAGERQAYATLMISAARMSSDFRYILPFTISNASITINNWNHLLLNIQAKNPYDGKYTHTYSGTLGSGKNSMTLTTVNPTTSKSNLIGVYSNVIYYVVNPDNSVTVLDALDGSNSTTTDPSSYYDPATQTFHLDFAYYGAYHIVETLVMN